MIVGDEFWRRDPVNCLSVGKGSASARVDFLLFLLTDVLASL